MTDTARRLLAPFRNALGAAKGYGGCFRCGDTWNWTQSHTTTYKSGRGCFPLCERCWASLTPETRAPYYDLLVNEWIRQLPSERTEYDRDRTRIREAVMAGG